MFSWTKLFSFLARLGNILLDLVEKKNWSKKNAARQKEIEEINTWVTDGPDTNNNTVMRLRAKIKPDDADES